MRVLAVEFFESRTIFLTVGNVHIYWYGLIYVAAFWAAWWLLPLLGRMRGLSYSRDAWTSLIAWGSLGVLVGGRLGYALLYEPSFFLRNPVELFQIWHGGMSSHGGFVGAALGVWFAMRRLASHPSLLLTLADVIAPVAALGLMLGRIGNVLNGEFGIYPYYEAMGDAAISVVCYVLLRAGRERGKVFAIFLLLYSIQRFLLEYIRPQEWPSTWGFSRGQLLTIPLVILGVILLRNARKRTISETL